MVAISIIIPAYNVENHIYNTLNSLLSQDDLDFEIIIINDGSTDSTVNVAKKILSESDFKNYLIIDKPNGGVSSARNRGIAEASGEYLFFLDGDDYVSHDFIKTLKIYLSDGKPDVLAWGYNLVREDKSEISNYFNTFSSEFSRMTGIETLGNILFTPNSLWIWTCSILYKKDIVLGNNIIFTEGCSNGEDQEFVFKVLSRAKDVQFINKILSFYVQREGSISSSYNIKKFDSVYALDRTAKYIKKNIPDADWIAGYIENNQLIGNYFYNFDSFIKYLHYERGMSSIRAINNLMIDINLRFPELNDLIRNKIKTVNHVGLKNKIKYKIFLINPLVYFYIIKLNDKIQTPRNLIE